MYNICTTADYSAFSISQGATCPRAQGVLGKDPSAPEHLSENVPVLRPGRPSPVDQTVREPFCSPTVAVRLGKTFADPPAKPRTRPLVSITPKISNLDRKLGVIPAQAL